MLGRISYCEVGEALEQFSQRSCERPIAGSVRGQVGWGSEQVGLMETFSVHVRAVEIRLS